METVKKWFTDMFDFIDDRFIVRRFAFFWVMYLTYKILMWSLGYVEANPNKPGLEMAAILGAVWGPMSILQGAVFKFYDDGRNVRA